MVQQGGTEDAANSFTVFLYKGVNNYVNNLFSGILSLLGEISFIFRKKSKFAFPCLKGFRCVLIAVLVHEFYYWSVQDIRRVISPRIIKVGELVIRYSVKLDNIGKVRPEVLHVFGRHEPIIGGPVQSYGYCNILEMVLWRLRLKKETAGIQKTVQAQKERS